MKNKSIRSKVMAGLIMASMVISTNTVVFAVNNVNGNENSKSKVGAKLTVGTIKAALTSSSKISFVPGSNKGVITKLDALVTAGTITATEETAIEAALTTTDKIGTGVKVGIKAQLDALVTTGIITSTQEAAIETVLTPVKIDTGTSKLDALVTAGTITATEEGAIKVAIATADKVDLGIKTGIKAQLDALVTIGIITSTQETSIEAALISK